MFKKRYPPQNDRKNQKLGRSLFIAGSLDGDYRSVLIYATEPLRRHEAGFARSEGRPAHASVAHH